MNPPIRAWYITHPSEVIDTQLLKQDGFDILQITSNDGLAKALKDVAHLKTLGPQVVFLGSKFKEGRQTQTGADLARTLSEAGLDVLSVPFAQAREQNVSMASEFAKHNLRYTLDLGFEPMLNLTNAEARQGLRDSILSSSRSRKEVEH